jgi:hypothetical protein
MHIVISVVINVVIDIVHYSGVEVKVTDDAGNELPRDGKTFGHLVRF